MQTTHKLAELPELAELQAWFLTVMTAPGGMEAGLALAHSRFGLAATALLRPGRGERSGLQLHADGYLLRLLDCLRADFPVLRHAMGGELFDFFARAYVWRHPPRAPSLYALGAGFADFLHASQHTRQRTGQAAPQAALLRLPVDLARLERACAEAGRAPGLEGRAPPTAEAFDLLLGQAMALRLAPCTRLLALSFPLHAWWDAASRLADEAPLPPTPEPQPCFLAVARLHYRVSVHPLQAWQYHYLDAARDGAAAHSCAVHAARQADLPVGLVLADALLWQATACAAGMLEPEPEPTPTPAHRLTPGPYYPA
jgi:hypothetical protein